MRTRERICIVALLALAAGCGGSTGSGESASGLPFPVKFPGEGDVNPTPIPTGTPAPGPKVSFYADGHVCSTSVVRPLSTQLITELDCLVPNAVKEMPADNQIDATGIFDYLQTKPGLSLPVVANGRPGVTMHVNSALRSTAQQYLLYAWYQSSKCGITLAATPGTSRHERGLSVDIQDHTGWMNAMTSHSWTWLGSSDPVHFDYGGSGTVDILGQSVKAFQRLWNLNHPNDQITEDGVYGPQTASRIAASPVNGFAISNDCGNDPNAFAPLVEDDAGDGACAM
jgi:hypothetical protein